MSVSDWNHEKVADYMLGTRCGLQNICIGLRLRMPSCGNAIGNSTSLESNDQ